MATEESGRKGREGKGRKGRKERRADLLSKPNVTGVELH